MSELDLIPAEYRLWIWQIHWLKRWAWMLGSVIAVTFASHIALSQATRRIQEEVHALEQRKNITVQQKQAIEQLQAEHDEITHRLDVLETIRQSDATQATLLAIDHAIAGKSVWFQQWQYEKGSALPGAEAQPPRLTLKGQALNHGALTGFVAALLSEPGIEEAQITRSALRRYVTTSVVDFEVIVTLSKPGAAAH